MKLEHLRVWYPRRVLEAAPLPLIPRNDRMLLSTFSLPLVIFFELILSVKSTIQKHTVGEYTEETMQVG